MTTKTNDAPKGSGLNITLETFMEAVFDPATMTADEAPCLSKAGKDYYANYLLKGFKHRQIKQRKAFYYCVSSVDPHGEKVRRRRVDLKYAYVVGLDDIGTKAKEPHLEPSYKMETSPGNFQWGYLIEPYELDDMNGMRTLYYEGCIAGLIAAGLSDPGATGSYRLLRVPGSINTKRKHDGWRSRVTGWKPDRIWELEDLMRELGVAPIIKQKAVNLDVRHDDVVFDWLMKKGRVQETGNDFQKVECPWHGLPDTHDDGSTWASYSPKGFGADGLAHGRQFNCFHSHTNDKDEKHNIHDFLSWVAEQGGPDVGEFYDTSLRKAKKHVKKLVKKGGIGDWFTPESMAAFTVIEAQDKSAYYDLRAKAGAVKGVGIRNFDKELAGSKDTGHKKLTHSNIADGLIEAMRKSDKAAPVGVYGELYRVNGAGLWVAHTRERQVTQVGASEYDGQPLCSTKANYTGIADLVYTSCSRPEFFADAPEGFAAGGMFYSVTTDGVVSSALSPKHRCKFQIPVAPNDQGTPEFMKLLSRALDTGNAAETRQQIRVMQEVFGGILTGSIAPLQKVVELYGATRAGKRVVTLIMEAMLPADAISAASPFKWDDPYTLAQMAGKKLNLVGEFPEDNQLPATAFKMVSGLDQLEGRHPYGRPFNFISGATQVFSSNFLPYCREQSDAFYARWQGIHFPNTVPEVERDPDLAARIISEELGGIVQWALEGAVRLKKQKRFSNSVVNDRLLSQWRLRSDTCAQFVTFCGLKLLRGKTGQRMKRSEFYSNYSNYCMTEDITRKLGKQTFYARLESVGGVESVKLSDSFYFRAKSG